MSRHRSYFVYFGLALGLICYLTFIDKKIPGTKEQEDSETRLYQISPDDVTGLEINNVHGLFIFEKDHGHWEIRKPIRTPADGTVVEEIVNQILYAQPQRSIPIDGSDAKTESDLKEWGLSPAVERVVIHTRDKTYELLLGRKMAINDSIYARTSGKKNAPVRIIPNEVKTILQKDLSDLRSRNVFDFDSDKVLKVDSRVAETPTIPAQECAVAFKDGKWTLEKPIVARAAEPDVLSLLNKILALHVTDFIVDDASNLSQYGLTSPAETLTITIKPQEELVLQIGAPVPGKPDQVYAQRATANSVFTLPKSAVDDVFTALPNVRDRHVMPFNPGKANSLAFSFGRKKGDAKIQNGVWHTLSTPAGHGDVGKITDILAHLNQLETTPVLKDSATDLKPFGLDQPQGKITVTLPGAEAPLTLLIGKDENKLLYVRNSIEPFIYTVDDHAFDFLPDGNLDLLDARAINLQLANVKSMRILAPPAPAILLTRSPGGTWSAANVKDRMVDSLKADTQASLFCQLLAQKWLGPVLPAYKLDHPVLVLTVQANDPKPTILTVGATLPDGTHAAQVTGTPTAFAIADGDFAVLNNSSLMPIPAVAAPPTNAPMTPVDPHQVKTD